MSEKVLAIDRKNLPELWLKEKLIISLNNEDTINELTNYIEWHERILVENNTSIKQIIPYIVVENKNTKQIACYERAGTEKRIHGSYSIGIGGHINTSDYHNDYNLTETILRSAHRELHEEFKKLEEINEMKFHGIINEELTKVGKTHIGLVFKLILNEQAIPGHELKNLRWETPDKIINNYNLELWSRMTLKLLYPSKF